MDEKPELIAFSQYKLGGIQSYFYNLLANDPYGQFNKKWIFHDDALDNAARLPDLYDCCEELIFPINEIPGESLYKMADRLEKHISENDGIILASFHYELITLHLHRRKNKVVFFICHDMGYLSNARRYEFIIDVFIAHNIQFYEELQVMFPDRIKDIYFLPYGIPILHKYRAENREGNLRLVILSRMDREKGVLDIPEIDSLLRKKGIAVQWTIIGDGPDKSQLQELVISRDNFSFFSPPDNKSVMELVAQNDVFILPSRLDGLPVALLETMSAGCVPVISEFNQGIKRVVSPEEGFIVPVGDSQQFADSIAILNVDRILLEKMSHAAREKIEREYDVKLRVKDYYELFNKYKEFKRAPRFHFHRYAGWLDYPFVPQAIKKSVTKIRRIIAK